MPCANPPVHLLNIFSLETVLPLFSLLIWGAKVFLYSQLALLLMSGPEETPGRVHVCFHLSSSLAGEQRAVFPNLTFYELMICFTIGLIVTHILKTKGEI